MKKCCKKLVISKVEKPCLLGWANINANGTIADSCGDVTVVRNAVGQYSLTPPVGTLSQSFDVVEALNTRDSIEIHSDSFVGGTVHISEGDNGPTPNTLRDRNWSVLFYGKCEEIEDVVLK